MNIPFNIGDKIYLDNKERIVEEIDMMPRMGQSGWVRLVTNNTDMWFCIDYVLEEGRNLQYTKTPLWKKMQGNVDGSFNIDLRFISGVSGAASLVSLAYGNLELYMCLMGLCLMSFAVHHGRQSDR